MDDETLIRRNPFVRAVNDKVERGISPEIAMIVTFDDVGQAVAEAAYEDGNNAVQGIVNGDPDQVSAGLWGMGTLMLSMVRNGGLSKALAEAADCPIAPSSVAKQPTYVLGRQVDTAVAKDWAGHSVLDIPDWTLAKNDAWIKNIVDTRGTVYLGSPQARTTLWDAVNNRPTVFARELEQLRAAGYTQVGDYMLPPGVK